MTKEIQYTGLTTAPSDYECPDGSLAVAINLLPENGALQPIMPPARIMELQEGEAVMYIHKTTASTNYITYNGETGQISFLKIVDGIYQRTTFGQILGVKHFNAVGNTLIAFTSAGINYYLWKNGTYAPLGDHIPDVEVSFGLVGHPRLFSLSDDSKSTFTINFDSISSDGIYSELSENNKNRITEQIMAKVNKFVAQETVNKGRFCFPFFVRYALRLFDGSLVCHSAPVLMNPSTKAAPIVLWKRVSGKTSYTTAECDIMLVASTLDYLLVRNTDSYHLEDWADIIKSIDVFISKPIYTYDQNGKITSMSDTDNYTTKFIGRLHADNLYSTSNTKTEDKLLGEFSSREFLRYYCEWEYAEIYSMYYANDRKYPITTFHLPEFTEGKTAENLRNTATFYKLCSISLGDAMGEENRFGRHDIIVEDDYLQSLVTREAMTDDYLSRDSLHADYSFAYNNRLNLAGIRRKPFKGFLAQSMFAFCNGRYKWNVSGTIINISMGPMTTDSYKIRVYIKENGEDYAVETNQYESGLFGMKLWNSIEIDVVSGDDKTTVMSRHSWGCYVYYPNPNAYKMVIYNNSTPCYAIDLTAHDFLNGAYALLDYELVREKNFTSLPAATPSDDSKYPIPVPNKIYTSEVNNPFIFPVLGINTVGTGEIRGISSAAKALSQGQFGQFPLYAFTTEGVWALEVSGTGTYTARQPITRDVCINPKGITQLDAAVLFPTDRGIMLISGSQTKCISEAIDTECPFDATTLPGFTKLHDMLGHEPATDHCLPALPFRTFLRQCRMIYDYVHQRVIVYAPSVTYAYVYSLKTNQWGMMFSDITSNLNAYPDALVVDKNHYVRNFCLPQDTKVKCLYLTRPLKLDAPDVFKTVYTILQRGHFKRGDVATVLYGSRDLYNWHLVWSSADHILRGFGGTPYKYFRIAGVATLQDGKSVYGASINFNTRQTNKLR